MAGIFLHVTKWAYPTALLFLLTHVTITLTILSWIRSTGLAIPELQRQRITNSLMAALPINHCQSRFVLNIVEASHLHLHDLYEYGFDCNQPRQLFDFCILLVVYGPIFARLPFFHLLDSQQIFSAAFEKLAAHYLFYFGLHKPDFLEWVEDDINLWKNTPCVMKGAPLITCRGLRLCTDRSKYHEWIAESKYGRGVRSISHRMRTHLISFVENTQRNVTEFKWQSSERKWSHERKCYQHIH